MGLLYFLIEVDCFGFWIVLFLWFKRYPCLTTKAICHQAKKKLSLISIFFCLVFEFYIVTFLILLLVVNGPEFLYRFWTFNYQIKNFKFTMTFTGFQLNPIFQLVVLHEFRIIRREWLSGGIKPNLNLSLVAV